MIKLTQRFVLRGWPRRYRNYNGYYSGDVAVVVCGIRCRATFFDAPGLAAE
jgi:hypothetical protein